MSNNPFQKAIRTQAKLRLGLDGPSGSGKTYTALVAATALANGAKIAVIDTERNSASLYSDKFAFDVACLDAFHPQNYIDLIHTAEDAGYSVIVVDSLSHAWEGQGGVLDLHDQAVKKQKTENSFTAWKDVTPVHRALVDAMLQSKCHIIATMRSKTEYVIESVERNGRTIQQPKKVGMAPIQRQGMEYEFTIVGDLDIDHNLRLSKSRMEQIADAVVTKPDVKWFGQIAAWLNTAVPAPASTPPPFTAPNTQMAGAQQAPATDAQSGNGHKPAAAPAPATTIEDQAALLWPGLDRLPNILAACNGDRAKTAEMLAARLKEIKTAAGMKTHLDKSWPGSAPVVDRLKYDPARHPALKVIRGVANAWAKPSTRTVDEALAAIQVEFDIPNF
jgi:hypothetical protein